MIYYMCISKEMKDDTREARNETVRRELMRERERERVRSEVICGGERRTQGEEVRKWRGEKNEDTDKKWERKEEKKKKKKKQENMRGEERRWSD